MRKIIERIKIPLTIVGTVLITTILTFILFFLLFSTGELFGFYEFTDNLLFLLFLLALCWSLSTIPLVFLFSRFVSQTYRIKFKIYSFILSTFPIAVVVIRIYYSLSRLSFYHGSFIEGTKVLTPTGTKLIENLKVGDQIIGYESEVNRNVISNVQKNRTRTTEDYYLINNALGVTSEHPLAIRRTNGLLDWKRVRELSLGEKIISYYMGDVEIYSLEKRKIQSPLYVYNPQVSYPNNYFIIVGNTAILAHNKH